MAQASIEIEHSAVHLSMAVTSAAYRAGRCSFGVIDAMPHGWQRSQVREDRLQIIIGHVAKITPRHDRTKLSGAGVAGAQCLNKESFVVVRNTRSVRGDVSAVHVTPWPFERYATGKR